MSAQAACLQPHQHHSKSGMRDGSVSLQHLLLLLLRHSGELITHCASSSNSHTSMLHPAHSFVALL
jgi:hypothetical protein